MFIRDSLLLAVGSIRLFKEGRGETRGTGETRVECVHSIQRLLARTNVGEDARDTLCRDGRNSLSIALLMRRKQGSSIQRAEESPHHKNQVD